MRHKIFGLMALLIASPAFATDPQFGAIRVQGAPNVRHTATTVTTNANLTGPITSVGNATPASGFGG